MVEHQRLSMVTNQLSAEDREYGSTEPREIGRRCIVEKPYGLWQAKRRAAKIKVKKFPSPEPV
jgi:hypothetical protein